MDTTLGARRATNTRPPPVRRWTTHEVQRLTPESLRALLANEIPLVVIPAFASLAECSQLLEAANRIGFEPYQHVEPSIDRIGVTVFEYNQVGMAAYFSAQREAARTQRAIFDRSFDANARLARLFGAKANAELSIARDPLHGDYHAGLVRKIESGTLLHIDYAPAEQPGWWVADHVEAQLAWNLYLQLQDDPAAIGVTHVYNRAWTPSDEARKVEGTYGYARDVVAGVERITYCPTRGDVYLFNSRNFHEVEASRGQRVTFTSQMGMVGPSQLVIWS
ncbi:hypothetical protein BH11MYX1_BH11MYX1_40420 [soil metagenome]